MKPPAPDIGEDRRRLDEFKRTGLAVPLDDVKAWVASWGSADELPRPQQIVGWVERSETHHKTSTSG